MVAAILAAAIATIASWVVARQHLAEAAFHPRWWMQAWHLLKLEPQETWKILTVLARQLFAGEPAPSRLRAVRFDAGGDDPHAGMRRALAITLPTMAPNFIVIGIDRERGLLLFHQIAEGPVSAMTRNLGAKP